MQIPKKSPLAQLVAVPVLLQLRINKLGLVEFALFPLAPALHTMAKDSDTMSVAT